MKQQNMLRVALWLVEVSSSGPESEGFAGDLMEFFAAGRSGWWCLAQALRRTVTASEQRLRSLLAPFWFSIAFVSLYPLWQRLYAPSVTRLLMQYRGTVQWPGSAVLELTAGLFPAILFVWVGVFVYGLLRHRSVKMSPVVAMLSLNIGAFLLFISMVMRLRAMHNELRSLSHADFFYPFVHTRFSLLLLLSLFGAVVVLPRERRSNGRSRSIARILSRCGLLQVARTLGLLTLLVPQVCAQAVRPEATPRLMGTDGKPIEFDVVSVKPNHTGAVRMDIGSAPMSDALTITNMPPENIIQWAFGIFLSDQIVGLPDWTLQERYDVEAKVSNADIAAYRKVIDPIQRAPMLQKILIDRFGLKFHYETKDLSVYALTVGKNGPRLTEIQPAIGPNGMKEGGGRQRGRGLYISMGQPMKPFINELTVQLKNPVVDRTGLTGFYNYTLHWTPDDGTPAAADDGLSIFTAIQEQLGLKLERVKAPIQVLVIDHIERPSSN
jgi:uncharacterized protein (TIGR03435 family)